MLFIAVIIKIDGTFKSTRMIRNRMKLKLRNCKLITFAAFLLSYTQFISPVIGEHLNFIIIILLSIEQFDLDIK